MLMMASLMSIVGLGILTLGAELLVRGASRLAVAIGISPLVVGLTVVAFGTSAPELVVSIRSTLADQPDVAIGNVLGSNIFNVLFILGISALIVPLRVSQQLIRFDVPLMVGLSLAVGLLAWDGSIGRYDGLALTTGLVVYTLWAIVKSRGEQAAIRAEYEAEFGVTTAAANPSGYLVNAALLVGGLLLLVLGGRWFVDGATTIARGLGVSELVIGLTIVAIGTSLPEVATSLVAAIRGERDIAVGNVVGSNLFNIMGVLGIASLVSPAGIAVSQSALWLDIPVMIAVAIACLPIFFTGHRIDRWEGCLLLACYVAYTISIIITATLPADTARSFQQLLLGVIAPLTLVTIVIGIIRHVRGDHLATVELADADAAGVPRKPGSGS